VTLIVNSIILLVFMIAVSSQLLAACAR